MIDPNVQYRANDLAIHLETGDLHSARLATQQLVYALGGGMNTNGMAPGAAALYILSLTLANRNGAIQ